MAPRKNDTDIRTPGIAGETVVALFDDQAMNTNRCSIPELQCPQDGME